MTLSWTLRAMTSHVQYFWTNVTVSGQRESWAFNRITKKCQWFDFQPIFHVIELKKKSGETNHVLSPWVFAICRFIFFSGWCIGGLDELWGEGNSIGPITCTKMHRWIGGERIWRTIWKCFKCRYAHVHWQVSTLESKITIFNFQCLSYYVKDKMLAI